VVAGAPFLKGGGLIGGAILSASLFGQSVKQVYGEPIVIPKETRTIEGGLAAFTLNGRSPGPVIVLTRFGRSSPTRSSTADRERPAFYNSRRRGRRGRRARSEPVRQATLVMTAEAWMDVL